MGKWYNPKDVYEFAVIKKDDNYVFNTDIDKWSKVTQNSVETTYVLSKAFNKCLSAIDTKFHKK